MAFQHIFGPVLSRRLGVSLGVDLVYHKVCSLDCVYCECGKTTDLTRVRSEYVSFDAVCRELEQYWAENDDPDYITFSGSGEPTLHRLMGRVIDYIKTSRPRIKVAVLTNATLMTDADVRKELSRADLVVPSLDAVNRQAFLRINRPCPGIDPLEIADGIARFAATFDGQIWLEVFILPGINDKDHDIRELRTAIQKIRPDRVQLNTLDRPGTRADLEPADRETMDRVTAILGMENVEVIAHVRASGAKRRYRDLASAVLETIHRRPCTLDDLVGVLGTSSENMAALLTELEDRGKIESRQEARGTFFRTRKENR